MSTQQKPSGVQALFSHPLVQQGASRLASPQPSLSGPTEPRLTSLPCSSCSSPASQQANARLAGLDKEVRPPPPRSPLGRSPARPTRACFSPLRARAAGCPTAPLTCDPSHPSPSLPLPALVPQLSKYQFANEFESRTKVPKAFSFLGLAAFVRPSLLCACLAATQL